MAGSKKNLLKRTASYAGRLLLLLFAVSLITFLLVDASPVDPAQANVGQAAWTSMSEAKREAIQAYWGQGTPFAEKYLHWLAGALHGDLGTSLRFNAPVAQIIALRAGNTLLLMTVAWIVSGVLGFVLGIIAALYRDSLLDRLVRGYCFVVASSPAFWIGLIILMVFSVYLGLFPTGFSVPIGKTAAEVGISDILHHLALPAITLSITGVANIALHTREKAIDVLNQDYMRFAQTKGLSRMQAMRFHGLRNLILPAITLQFASISEIFGGSVLVEQVFSYPGLGQAAITAGLGGDAPLLVSIAVFSAALVFAGNLIANILYGIVDPRISKGVRADA